MSPHQAHQTNKADPRTILSPAGDTDASAPDQAARWSKRWSLFLLWGLLALIGWEVGATLLQHTTAPREEDWQAAAKKLRALHRHDEPILFAPLWSAPLGRHYFGDQVNLEMMLLSDVDPFARVWEVSTRGARHGWLAGLAPRQHWSFGPVMVQLFEKPAEQVLFDFTRQISRAQVDRVGDTLIHCPWQSNRFVCEAQRGWNWVGPHIAEVNHQPYRCIYAHPVEGHLMRLTFSAVPLGRRLVGYTGIDDFENRKRSRHPVQFSMRVGRQLSQEIQHHNDWPWHQFILDTSSLAGQQAEVRFEISAKQAFARAFCFAVQARR